VGGDFVPIFAWVRRQCLLVLIKALALALGIFKIGSYSIISFNVDVWNRVIPHSCSTFVYLIALLISETRQVMYV
jgi:hypothetical protein